MMKMESASKRARTECDTKEKIREYLHYTLPECYIPELGESKKGKVRDIYFSGENVVMVTNDRVSAFDFVLPNLIPFKGQVLNMISEYTMSQTRCVLKNALVSNVDNNVVVQKKMQNLNVEFIVRSYLWGSMAAAYEKGERTFCGLQLPDGLVRYQKLDELLFTPTTKAEVGHDENMTMAEVEKLLGVQLAQKARQAALDLFKKGSEIMRDRGLILLDTKYEFGLDNNGELHVIDEVNTPDSSRLIEISEWESKFPKIKEHLSLKMRVDAVLKTHPELKMKEYSKQYVRDVLLDAGFDPVKHKTAPQLTEEQVVECSYRYITIYEKICGQAFVFPESAAFSSPAHRVVANLQKANLIKGCLAVIAAGSDSDMPHLETLKKELAKFNIPSHIRICSAHKQPGRLQQVLEMYNKSSEPLIIVGCAGGTDALSGTASYLSKFPVVSCPPDGMNNTCLTNPPGSSNAFIKQPSNVAKFCAQSFALTCPKVAEALEISILEKITKLERADAALTGAH